jgi:hypothetical protein
VGEGKGLKTSKHFKARARHHQQRSRKVLNTLLSNGLSINPLKRGGSGVLKFSRLIFEVEIYELFKLFIVQLSCDVITFLHRNVIIFFLVYEKVRPVGIFMSSRFATEL